MAGMIKFWAFIYRLTGWYSPWAEKAQWEHLRNSLADIEKSYNGSSDSLENILGLYIGIWQANNGFTRKLNMDKMIKRAQRKNRIPK